jgi:hypothetical protein
MSRSTLLVVPFAALVTSLTCLVPPMRAQQDPGERPPGQRGPRNETLAVVARFDADGNGRLDAREREPARAWVKENKPRDRMRGPGGPGPGPGFDGPPPGGARADAAPRDAAAPSRGRTVRRDEVDSWPDRPVFDPDVVRTVFVEFERGDWFDELTDFYRTDVQIPATVAIDGETLRDVGIGFRGNTSFMMARGRKKSFDLSFDHVHEKQAWRGLRNLDLLNCHADASFVREALHGFVANRFFAAPRVGLVRVVVNGEDHGVYAAVQQFDKEFVADHFGTTAGDRFKVPPDFGGAGGLRWLGDEIGPYQRSYQLKSGSPGAWQALVDLCAVLEQTAAEDLERIVPQHLDVDSALWFLAVDNALGDDDGYHSRASDYLLYRDPKGRFHAIPRDNNEILLGERTGPGPRGGPAGGPPIGGPPVGGPPPDAPPGARGPRGPGGRGGPGGGVARAPLDLARRADRPLARLLDVPAWRERYLANLRVICTEALADAAIGARLAAWRELLDPFVAADVHSLYGHEAFVAAFAADAEGKPAPRSLLATIQKRRQAILQDAALQGAWPALAEHATSAAVDERGRSSLTVRVRSKGAAVAEVRLHHDRGAFGSFAALPMERQPDGTFAATLPAVDPGSTWRFWIEAVAADSGHVACLPPSGGALPWRWTAPKTLR